MQATVLFLVHFDSYYLQLPWVRKFKQSNLDAATGVVTKALSEMHGI